MDELRNKPISAKKNIPDRWIQLSAKRFSVIPVTCHALPWHQYNSSWSYHSGHSDVESPLKFGCPVIWQSDVKFTLALLQSGNVSMPPFEQWLTTKGSSKKVDDVWYSSQSSFSRVQVQPKKKIYNFLSYHICWPLTKKNPSNINQENFWSTYPSTKYSWPVM